METALEDEVGCGIHFVSKSRRMRWAGYVARVGEERNMYKFLMRKPEGKRPLGRPRRRWQDELRMDVGEIGLGV
jgi:hypothetical protein